MSSALNIKKVTKFLGTLFVCVLLVVPIFAYSEESIPKDGRGTGITYECKDADGIIGNCDFNDLLSAVNKVVNYAVGITLAFSVIVIAYVGGEYIIYADNPSKRSGANQRLVKVLKGIAFIMAAWLIVTLITNSLLKDNIKDVVPLK